ncbi:hypothetical protein BY458DRAFT_496667 [Sporodiniella umbellata]|nr:hypothetical protein BY458DRAFT_496667 [Sporodiniella umbellata]
MSEKLYDRETFQLTTRILHWTPDFYTVWNYRRTVLLSAILTKDEGNDQKVFQEELLLLLQLIKSNPKSYWLWNHRFWCLQTMPNPNWQAELGLVDKMLQFDARNFHGWNYRRYVTSHIREREKDVYKLIKSEYEFTTKKINQSFSNYSAWHQRSKLLPEIVAPMTTEEKNNVAQNELELVKNAIYTDPEDQSAWLYYWWLVGNVSEKVELKAVYHLKNTPFYVLAFNDIVRLTQKPEAVAKDGTLLQGNILPIVEDASKTDMASLWVYVLDREVSHIDMASETVLPSCSSKLSINKKWSVKAQEVERDSDICHNLTKWVEKNGSWMPSSLSRIYKDYTTNDQTEWFTLDKTQLLRNEIDTVRELLEIEPESSWSLQTLIHFLNQLALRDPNANKEEIYTEIVAKLDILMALDSNRKLRYKDQKEHFLFERLTSEVWDHKESLEELDISSMTRVPLLSKLILVSNIVVFSDEVQKRVSNLPFLKRCVKGPSL